MKKVGNSLTPVRGLLLAQNYYRDIYGILITANRVIVLNINKWFS